MYKLILYPFFKNGNLRVSKNGHYLEHTNGKSFFWLGDTAWELFHRLSKEDATYYFKKRSEQGFTVIQAVVAMGVISIAGAAGMMALEAV